MWPTILLTLYCILIVLASLAGGWMPFVARLTHARMQMLISGVAGLMLGVGLLHLLPHSVAQTGSLDQTVGWMLVGLLLMFVLVRLFDFHQHGVAEDQEQGGHEHEHDHDSRGGMKVHRLSWIGVACGLGLHTLIDGVALAAGVAAEKAHGGAVPLMGFGVFLAVLLHKPLDAMSITALMKAGRWPMVWLKAVNASFALMCPLGAGIFMVSLSGVNEYQETVVGCALGFSAGVFVFISLGDLLPELHFHTHDRFKLTAALFIGIALAWAIGLVEGEQMHRHEGPSAVQSADDGD